MELQVGIYVRLDRNQGIRKIEEYDEDIKRYYLDDDIYDAWGDPICTIEDEKDILKSSFNIIDLIEVRDIITYEYPTALGIVTHENVTVSQELLDILKNGENNHEYKIKSILTKEQFEEMEYKI